jgi:hypothetical protein
MFEKLVGFPILGIPTLGTHFVLQSWCLRHSCLMAALTLPLALVCFILPSRFDGAIIIGLRVLSISSGGHSGRLSHLPIFLTSAKVMFFFETAKLFLLKSLNEAYKCRITFSPLLLCCF